MDKGKEGQRFKHVIRSANRKPTIWINEVLYEITARNKDNKIKNCVKDEITKV